MTFATIRSSLTNSLWSSKFRQLSQCYHRYSPPLELAISNGSIPADLAFRAQKSDESILKEFSGNGSRCSAYCYFIFDPRISGRNPEVLTFETFVRSISYAGKGTGERLIDHFIDARDEKRQQSNKLKTCGKLKIIVESWSLGYGIPTLTFGRGVSDEVAFIREASIIKAIQLVNLTNKRAGKFFGTTNSWDRIRKEELGTYLIGEAFHKAKQEGFRLITESDLPIKPHRSVIYRREASCGRTQNTLK